MIYMLKNDNQMSMSLSKYSELFNILIPKDDILRQINEMVDFSFVYEALKDKYSSTMGRTAEDCIRMFKYLILKAKDRMSDRGLIARTRTDMAYKYFLGYEPEETKLIDPSLLAKFRRERIGDEISEENKDNSETATTLLDILINKTVEIAINKGIINIKNVVIEDSTHSNAMFQHISPREALIKQAKIVRKKVYKINEKLKDEMPKKRETSGLIEDQIEYTKELIEVLEKNELTKSPILEEDINYLKEILDDTEVELEYSKDQDAKVGHKTADTSFFGYKTHIAMTPERIITAATITSGEKHDGKQMQTLVEKSKKAGIDVQAVVGDGAYSESENIEYCEKKKIKLASKLSNFVMHGNSKKNNDFEYNKDAGMYVCKAGHMAVRKTRYGNKNSKDSKHRSEGEAYYFDVEKCKHCPYKEGCYKEGAKSKTYSVTIKNDIHIKHMDYMETDEFRELYSERYKIEAKNAELKNNYGYNKATACGKLGITIQGATTLFFANIKRIIQLEIEKNRNNG